jgi:hypothetical protein
MAWDDEWRCYYDVEEAEAIAESEAAMTAEGNRIHDQFQVRDWLEEQISDLADGLEPPSKSYSAYELKRQRTIVGNRRLLLELANHALKDAPASCSSAHLAYLTDECGRAEKSVSEALWELEQIENWCSENNVS